MFIYLYFKVNQFILFDLKSLSHGVSHIYLSPSIFFKGDNTNNLNVFNLELSSWTI